MEDNNSVLALNDDMVWEIVIRLPRKSLMRFKSVSKHWNKIIRDPIFAKSYIGGFHGLLIAHHTNDLYGSDDFHDHQLRSLANDCFPYACCFILDDHKFKRYSKIPGCYQFLLEDKYSHYWDYFVTNIEKGLCVLYQDGAFTLCNVTTHELLDIPINSPQKTRATTCYLGFEPVKGVYKLLGFFFDDKCENIDANVKYSCEICTLGGGEDNDLDWRSIEEPTLTYVYFRQSICINGILYLSQDYNQPLVAFDLSSETIQFISLPDFLTDEVELVKLGGSLAIINFTSERSIIWMLKDNKIWTKSQDMDLTGICGFNLICVGTLPTGEALLAPNRVTRDNLLLPIYKYDHIQNKLFNWIQLYIPFYDLSFGEYCHICYHEDNILPLDSLITRSKRSSATSRLHRS